MKAETSHSYVMFAGYERKIYVYKFYPDVSLSDHGWLSLIYFAVEMRERVEFHRMAMRCGFSLIAWNSWGSSERADRTRKTSPGPICQYGFHLDATRKHKVIMVYNLEEAGLLID